MHNITIGRYNGTPAHWDGWVEGVREDGSGWILFLDQDGSPAAFWAHRTEDGTVEGPAIDLT